MAGVYIEKGKNYNIPEGSMVKVTKYKAQNKAEVTAMAKRKSIINNFKKENANGCVDKRTGEFIEYKKNKIKPEKAVKRSMRKLEKLLTNNFSGEDDERFITLTTEEEVKDIQTLKCYVKSFLKALKRKYGKGFKSAYVIEMHQNRESWHVHIMTKGTKGLNNESVKKCWNKGWTWTVKITNEYTDFEIDIEKIMMEPNGFLASKRYYGIDRVISYMTKYKTKESIPTGARAYSVSRNLEKPDEVEMSYGEFKEECNTKNYTRQDEYTSLIRSVETDSIINKVKKEEWVEV